MWEGIFLSNRAGIRLAIRDFADALSRLDRLLRRGDAVHIRELLADAAAQRRRLGRGASS
jgi:prephenate dehydrogenase